MKIIEPYYQVETSLAKIIIRFGVDPWIGMLALGALGHRLNLPFLLKVGFLDAVLINLVWQALSPINHHDKYKVTEKKGTK